MSNALLKGPCHYGTVKFEVRTQASSAARCNCGRCQSNDGCGANSAALAAI
jgi:hypothetical protein